MQGYSPQKAMKSADSVARADPLAGTATLRSLAGLSLYLHVWLKACLCEKPRAKTLHI